jgi:uncharacterized membrane protein
MSLLLLLCYPLCVHFAVVTQTAALQVVAIVCLAAGIQYSGLRQGNVFAWGVLLGVALVSFWLASVDLARYVLYVPPIIIPLLIWSGFMRTLLPGQVPLVTAIGVQTHGQLPPEIERYTRRVTVFWAVFLAMLTLWAAVLPGLVSTTVWSLFSNFLNYALVGLLFLAEFIYRRWRFSDFEQPSLRQYLNIVFQSGVPKG